MTSRRKIALRVGLLLLIAGALAVWFAGGDLGETSAPERPDARLRTPGTSAPPIEPSPPATTDPGDEASPRTRRVEVLVSEMVGYVESRPIPGATVVLRDLAGRLRQAVTDLTGTAVFENTPIGESEARASAPGFAASPWTKSDRAERFVVLQRGIGIAGEVLDEISMQPVAGAEIRVVGGRPIRAGSGTCYVLPLDLDSGVTLATAVTGPDGRFLTDAVPPHRPVYVLASAGDRRSTFQAAESSSLKGPPTLVRLVLGRRGSIVGTVRDPGGRPAPEATVYAAPGMRADLVALFHDGSLPLRHVGNPGLLTARSGADGRFHLDGLRFDSTYVVAAAREDNAPSAPPAEITTTTAEPEVRLDLQLRLPGKLTVRVLGPDGDPVADASVTVSATNWGGSTVPGSGVHEFWSLRVSELTVRVRAPGHPPKRDRLTIPSGGRAEITLRLAVGLPMDGFVVDEQGRYVSDAEVTAWVLDEDGWLRSYATGKTDSGGHVHLEGLLPLVHQVRADGLGIGVADIAPGGAPFRIVLRPGGLLRGKVLCPPGGYPLGEIEVEGPDVQRAFFSRGSGYIFILPPGQYRLRTRSRFRTAWGEWSPPVEVSAGQATKFDLVAR